MSQQQNDLIPERIGDRLRAARQQKGWSATEAAQRLRLSVSRVNLMERDEWDELPAVYRQGYARNYLRLLGLAGDADLQSQVEALGSADSSELKPVFSGRVRESRLDRNLRVVTYAAATIFLVAPLVWFFTINVAKLSQGEALLSGADNTESSQQNPGTDLPVQANVVPLPRSQPPSVAAPAFGSEDTGNADEQAADLDMQSPEPETLQQSDTDANQDTTEDTGVELAAVDNSHHLALTLNADSWVSIRDASGKRLEHDLLKAGGSHDYHGEAPFTVQIGRAWAVELSLDGSPVDLSRYASGDVANLQLAAPSSDEG